MVDQVTDIASKLGMGGRLYQDARKKAGGDSEVTPEPKVEQQAPPIAQPWTIRSVEPTLRIEAPAKQGRDWQQIHATIVQLLGMAVLTAGVALIYIPAGVIVAGIFLIVLGVGVGLPAVPSRAARTRKGKS